MLYCLSCFAMTSRVESSSILLLTQSLSGLPTTTDSIDLCTGSRYHDSLSTLPVMRRLPILYKNRGITPVSNIDLFSYKLGEIFIYSC